MPTPFDHTLNPLTDSLRAQCGLACHAWAYRSWDCAKRRMWGLLEFRDIAKHIRERYTVDKLRLWATDKP